MPSDPRGHGLRGMKTDANLNLRTLRLPFDDVPTKSVKHTDTTDNKQKKRSKRRKRDWQSLVRKVRCGGTTQLHGSARHGDESPGMTQRRKQRRSAAFKLR